MTLISVKNYIENKWKNGHGSVLDKTKPVISIAGAVLILVAIVSIVVLKFLVVLTGKTQEFILIDIADTLFSKAEIALKSLSEYYGHCLWQLIKGISWTIASSMLLYLDSNSPGVNPPVTLSPRYGNCIPESFHHIGYVTTLAIGIVVFSLSLWNE